LYLAFFGPRRRRHAHDAGDAHADTTHDDGAHEAHHAGHLHDAPAPMAIALVVLAIGSILAGFVGVPHALGGHNSIAEFLAPSFQAPGVTADAAAGEVHADTATELALMALSTLIALGGIGVATVFFLRKPEAADRMAASAGGLHRLLLGKYYVDEIYDRVIVQPIKAISRGLLWRSVDAGIIDGTVNAVGLVVRGWSAVLRRLQTGSVRAYAMSLFMGVVVILGYFYWR
jgi:NADH-quinone oxidoreductase subunit L